MPNAFTTGLKGLLDTGMMGDIGTGLLSQSGWSQTPVSFGQAFGGAMQFANQRQAERFELDVARQKLEQERDRQRAMKLIQGLLTVPVGPTAGSYTLPGQGVAPIQTPQGQNQLMGLLGQVAPEAMAQGLIAQQFTKPEEDRVSVDLNTFRSLNPSIQPGSEQERTGFTNFLQSKNSLDPMDQARLTEMNLSMLRLQQQIESERNESNSREGDQIAGFNQLFRDLSEFRMINNSLSNTLLEPGGVGMNTRRGIQSMLTELRDRFGSDSAEYKQVLAQFDRAQQLQQGIVNRLGVVLGEDGLARTDAGRAALAGEKPDLEKTVEANNSTVDSLTNYLTEIADGRGIYIDPSLRVSPAEIPPTTQGLLEIDPNAMSTDQIVNLLDRLEQALNAR